MKSLGRFLIVFVVLCLPAVAEDRDLTIFAGAQFPGKITISQVTSGATETITDPTNAGLFGIRFGRARVVGHEETFAYTSKFLDSKSKSVILNSNLLVQAPVPAIKPYVTAGLGTIISWGSGPSDLGTKFGVNYGGGLKIRPAGPVGLRIDARAYSVFGVQSQTLKMGEVTAGILFAF
jgi:outer membrane protein with beta-barrel domain